ncbi:hypothetical protein M413DRAFT_449071 [Hebeloma cylindrosporum]|uniref:Uncharacterized protein n=1 Tax=Hebeloma cylindrosporum TaxID=76867 RepID=A0A0C3BWS1_HEBCY|nr:hypothetical protein M413DRAFT_449071 [Hebeloma cylindrosporum h7]
MHRFLISAATETGPCTIGRSSSLNANHHQFTESARMCAAELLSSDSGTRVDDPATAEILAMLGITTSGGSPSAVAIDCAPVDCRIYYP